MITTLCIAVGTGSEARSCGHVVVPLCGGLQSEATLLSGSRRLGVVCGLRVACERGVHAVVVPDVCGQCVVSSH